MQVYRGQVAPSVTTVLVMDPDGKRLWQGGGQRVPQEWISTIVPVPVAFEAGLCGTAAFLKERVVVPDVATEPNWPDQYRDLAIRNGIRAAWSEPILTKDNEVLGTFALYSHEARVPTDEDLAAHRRRRAHRAHRESNANGRRKRSGRRLAKSIKDSEARLRRVIDTIPTLAWCNSARRSERVLRTRRWDEYTGPFLCRRVSGWGWQAAFHPEDVPGLMEERG